MNWKSSAMEVEELIEVDEGHQPESRKPDNLVWVEEILMNNLEGCIDSPDPANCASQETQETINPKLMVAEIELRDENFGDERVQTLSRLLASRIKFLVRGDEKDYNQFWVIKIPSALAPERELSKICQVARREISFYMEVLPSIKLWVEAQYLDVLLEFKTPPCLYGRFLRDIDDKPDLEIIDHILDAESLLVLQDMRAYDYGKRHFSQGMNVQEAFAAIKEISKFHVVTWAMQVKTGEKLNWDHVYPWEDLVNLYEALFKRGYVIFANFLSNMDAQASPEVAERCGKLLENIRPLLIDFLQPKGIEDADTVPATLVHMDLWSENLLFRIVDDDQQVEGCDLDCTIIDWQMVTVNKPSHDLALLTVLSMDAPDRREYAGTILEYYYQLFQQTSEWFKLQIPFTFPQLVYEYSRSCVLAVIMAISSMDIVMMEDSTQVRLLEAIKDLMNDGFL